jgi:hypothetical protein
MNFLNVSTFIILIFLAGCAGPSFYNNGPINAKSFQQNLSVVQIDNQNSQFRVYKIDSKYYGIRYVRAASNEDTIIGKLNHAIIFNENQLAEFKEVCQKIIDSYNQKPESSVQIIEYHLTLNEPEVVTSSQTTFFSNLFSTDTQVKEFNRVIFRLQFANSPKTFLDFINTGKEISFMYGNHTGKMSINDLKELLNDLSK